MASIPAGNNPFYGGSITRSGQSNVSGGIAPANTNVSNPIGGVNPGSIFNARNNQGSNIGIPYTRLCPVGSATGSGLGRPPRPAVDPPGVDEPNYSERNVVQETEDLRNMTVAFILGKRSGPGVGNTPLVNPDGTETFEQSVDFGFSFNTNGAMAPGMPGTERFQKLCSFEYLSRYFTNALWSKGITLKAADPTVDRPNGTQFGRSPGLFTSGIPKMVLDAAIQRTKDRAELPGAENDAGRDLEQEMMSSHLTNVEDLCVAMGLPDSEAQTVRIIRQGIFAHDQGPFLRGKGITHEMLSGTKDKSPQGIGPNNKTYMPYNVSRCIGDELAFSLFEKLMEEKGFSDWRPDGIILSKGTDDPSDEMSDELLKRRDGELYNMRIQGPAITSSWTGDPALEVMPLDKVFVVIVADVWWGDLGTASGASAAVRTFVDTILPQDGSDGGAGNRNELRAYLRGREDELSGAGSALTKDRLEDFKKAQEKEFKANNDGEITRACNFRVMLATSSQMINYSALRFDANGEQVCSPKTDSSEFRRVHNQSRMGLRLGINGGEYIVGGWCIGNVLDTAASRAAFPSAGANIGVRTAPNSMAINVNVKIDWWDSDRMWRSFMNIDGSLTPRYVQTKKMFTPGGGGVNDKILYDPINMPPKSAIALTERVVPGLAPGVIAGLYDALGGGRPLYQTFLDAVAADGPNAKENLEAAHLEVVPYMLSAVLVRA